jgi:hypothetical protein
MKKYIETIHTAIDSSGITIEDNTISTNINKYKLNVEFLQYGFTLQISDANKIVYQSHRDNNDDLEEALAKALRILSNILL